LIVHYKTYGLEDILQELIPITEYNGQKLINEVVVNVKATPKRIIPTVPSTI
jgi:hypothetical protein